MDRLMYLVDTNVFLEGFLEQQKVEEVRSFFQRTDLKRIFITDISFHSIGIILFKFKKSNLFISFLDDMVINGGINIVSLLPDELKELEKLAQDFKLDFEDSYQYLAAKKYNLQLISFDSDFDRTERGRKKPAEIIEK